MASSVGRGCSISVLVAGLVFSGLCIPASADEGGVENTVTTEDSVNGESDVSSDESGNTEASTGETNTGGAQSGSEINTSTGDGSTGSATSGEPAPTDTNGGGLANGWGTSSWEIKDKVLHIGSGVTGPVSKSGGAPWRQNTSVTSVVFDDPENTVLNAQSAYLFYEMTNITSFEGINVVDTSQVVNMEGMFYRAGVKNLDLSAWDVSNVTNMSYMFSGISLRSLDLSAWDTSSVTDMNSMFLGASFSSLDVSSWDTSSVTNMYAMFTGIYLTSLDVSSWDTSSVTNMYAMFLNANYLKTLDLSTWDVSNVTNMDSMFFVHLNVGQEDNVLESLDISGWDTSNVTDMGGIFSGLWNLRVLKLGEKTRLHPRVELSTSFYVWAVVGDGSVEAPSGDWYGTADEISLRDEANRAGTYVRLDPVVDDSFKVSSPMEDGSAYGRVVVSGRGTAGNTVHLNGISRFLGSTIIDADGTWSIVSPFPLSGALKLTATQIAQGQTTTRPVIFTAKPILEDTSGALKVVAPSNGNTIREETAATGGTVISGNAKPETTINITTTNNTEGISDTVDANGIWSIVLGQKLLPGTHLLRITNTNTNTDTGTGTESGTDGVSGGLVSSVFVSDTEDHIKVSIDTPTYGTTTTTADGFVVVSGRGDVGASVVLYDHVGNKVGQETVVDTNGKWSTSLPLSNEKVSKEGLVFFGAKQITTNNQVSVFETYTNTNTETNSVVPVRVTSPTTETSVSGTSTVFEGTGNPGSTISIHGHVRTLGTTTVDSDGKWQITSTIDLPRMYYQLFATQTTNNEQQTQTIYITTN